MCNITTEKSGSQLDNDMVYLTSPPGPLYGRGGAGYFNFTNNVICVPFPSSLISMMRPGCSCRNKIFTDLHSEYLIALLIASLSIR